MDITKNIKDINNLPDENIVIGVSAGPDSMALLDMLIKYTNKTIICAHVNHNVRSASITEEAYLKEYCNKHNITFESIKIDEYTGKNFENEAREKRYAFYEKILKKYNSHYLLLAHHGDDLIETILMKIIRGSNLEGYAGIKMYSVNNNYTIIRPLLYLTKEDILIYNKENNIKFFVDKTNEDTKYTRNRYRKNILPLVKEEDKDVHLKFLKYSNTLQEYYNYVEDITKEKIKNDYKDNTLDINKLLKEHPFIIRNIIFYILSNIYNNKANYIKDKHIDSIIKLATSDKPNQEVNLPNGIIAKKEYNIITIEKHKIKKDNYKLKLNDYIEIDNMVIKKVDKIDTDGNDVCRLNSKDIKLPLYIRNKKNGDTIEVMGLNGKKKVKDIFIDKKIPLDKRSNYPLLVDDNDNILWIPNIKKSKYNVKKDGIYDIILTCYKERKE